MHLIFQKTMNQNNRNYCQVCTPEEQERKTRLADAQGPQVDSSQEQQFFWQGVLELLSVVPLGPPP